MAIISASRSTCDVEAAVEGDEMVTLTTGLKRHVTRYGRHPPGHRRSCVDRDNKTLARLLKYDSVLGRLPHDVSVDCDDFVAGDQRIEAWSIADGPAAVP